MNSCKVAGVSDKRVYINLGRQLGMSMGTGIELKITVYMGKKNQLIFFFHRNNGATEQSLDLAQLQLPTESEEKKKS